MNNEPAMAATFELRIEISAVPEKVWRALVHDIKHWWPAEFLTSDKSRGVTLEAKPGGRLFEDYGDESGLLWYRVVAIEHGTSLSLAGHLLPPFGGPAMTALFLHLSENSDGTILTIRDSIVGVVDRYDPVEDWRLLFGGGLKQFVEQPTQ